MMKNIIKSKNDLIIGFCYVVQIILLVSLFVLKSKLLYSGVIVDIFCLTFIVGVGIVIDIFCIVKIFKCEKKMLRCSSIVFIIAWLINVFYIGKCVNAFRYENNYELVVLSERYSLKESKNIKKKIDKIFEYDFDNVSSRDIKIGNFYEDEEIFVLYLDDLYDNYRLKFYLKMNDDNIESIYWELDDYKFYLVEDFKKTKNFEYYYAMNIFNSVRDIEIASLKTIDVDIEKFIKNEFINYESANVIFTYEELKYNEKENIFSVLVYAHNMNYYGEGEDSLYEVKFSFYRDENKKKIWYYGDSSFEIVKWDIYEK